MSTEDETYWNEALNQVANEQIEHKFTKPFLRPAYDCSLEEENPCTPCAPASLQSICKQYLHKNIKITCKVNRFITYSDYTLQEVFLRQISIPRTLKIELITNSRVCKIHGYGVFEQSSTLLTKRVYILPHSRIYKYLQTEGKLKEEQLQRYFRMKKLIALIREAFPQNLEWFRQHILPDLVKGLKFSRRTRN